MKKLLKSRKALSPVVAAIILIAVTVAVSIAVAAWMGALTFTFMKTEQLRITHVSWNWAGAGSRYLNLTVQNTGTASATVDYAKVGTTEISLTDKTIESGTTAYIKVKYDYTNGTTYDISIITTKGNEFSTVKTAPS